jgi:TonB family protein
MSRAIPSGFFGDDHKEGIPYMNVRRLLSAAAWITVAACSSVTTGAISQDPECSGRVAVSSDLLATLSASEIEQFLAKQRWVPAGTRVEAIDTAALPRLANARQVQTSLLRRYPPELRNAGVGGTTIVRLLIDSSGRARLRAIMRSSGRAQLDSVAMESVREMRFQWASPNGCIIPVVTDVPIVLTAS